ncbi:MAG: amidase, partial [Clostridiales bacterium]|nr:amidase [Clostridiales bacterium]
MNYHYYNEKIENLSILELKELLDNGSITSEQLIWAYVERIAYIDKQGPKINAVREINPDVFSIAEERDYQRKNGEILGPLHGIPILLKDCINTKDKIHTTCGAMALKDYYAESDAFIVELLRKAGAIILGKATISEWYGFISSNAVSGFNGLSGPAKNPYGPGILPPGGSSGGCAAAVSADMTAAAIGTETSGSIIEPAYFCSVVGFKPTAGLISRSGILPVTMFQDAPGFLTKSVADTALLLNILAVRDKDDSGTWRADKFEKIDIPSMADEDLKGKKIGVIREGYFEDLDDEAKDIYEKSFNALRQSGAEVI